MIAMKESGKGACAPMMRGSLDHAVCRSFSTFDQY
jgi:hypothetical protein